MSTAKINSLRTLMALSMLVLVVFLKTSIAIAGGLEYSTFLGGSENDSGSSIDVDAAGNAYVSGGTWSSDFPTTPGAFSTAKAGQHDAIVAKLANSGSELVYSTFLGGNDNDEAHDLDIDAFGNVYLTGFTVSSDFPATANAYDSTPNGVGDVFVAKLDASGSVLRYSTYLGGDRWDEAWTIVVGPARNVYVAGQTASSDFPTTQAAFDRTCGSDGNCNHGVSELRDGFVTKLNRFGSSLSFSTFVGGSSYDRILGLAIDSERNTYVTGSTESTDFHTTNGAFDETHNDFADAFGLKLNADGSSLAYSTFIGGYVQDWGSSISVDDSGHAYIAGKTDSFNFPTTPGAFDQTHDIADDVFALKLSPAGSSLSYSTFIGGSGTDRGNSISVDDSGSAYIAGDTSSFDFPATPGAFDETHSISDSPGALPNTDTFTLRLNPSGSALEYSTFIGGSDDDDVFGAYVGASGSVYMTGRTLSSNFPHTAGAFDETHNGSIDAFVTKLNIPDVSTAVEIVGPGVGPTVVSPGGTIRYIVTLRNNTESAKSFGAKTHVSGPPNVDPLDGPIPATLGSLASASRTLSKTVPILVPLGTYNLCVVAFDGPATLDEACAEFEIIP